MVMMSSPGVSGPLPAEDQRPPRHRGPPGLFGSHPGVLGPLPGMIEAPPALPKGRGCALLAGLLVLAPWAAAGGDDDDDDGDDDDDDDYDDDDDDVMMM